jgi:dihydroorotate dehydrogenase (NAD+) catalytic subunit
VTRGRDLIEMLLVGATAVGIGSALNYGGIEVFRRAVDELETYMDCHGHRSLEDFRGRALPKENSSF